MEIWKDIKEYVGFYQVSNMGRVRSLDRERPSSANPDKFHMIKGKIIKPARKPNGYLVVCLHKNGEKGMKYVHRLVAIEFVTNEESLETVNHIDGNKNNNCEVNLEWLSHDDNVKHAVKTGLMDRKGVNHNINILNEEDVMFIRSNYRPRDKIFSQKKLAEMFGVSPGTIGDAVHYRTWRHIQ